ncbi:MAG: NifU family protein [Methylocystaceae bacterium]
MLDTIQQIIDQYIAPALTEHGGGIELLSYTADGTVQIRLLGQCCNCPASQITLNELVLATLKQKLPQVENVELVESPAGLELMDLARQMLAGKAGSCQ